MKNKIDPTNHFFDFGVLTVQNCKNFISVLFLQLILAIRSRWLTKQIDEFWLKISWRIRDKIKLFGFSTIKTAKSKKWFVGSFLFCMLPKNAVATLAIGSYIKKKIVNIILNIRLEKCT